MDQVVEEAVKILSRSDLQAAAGGISEADHVEMLKRALREPIARQISAAVNPGEIKDHIEQVNDGVEGAVLASDVASCGALTTRKRSAENTLGPSAAKRPRASCTLNSEVVSEDESTNESVTNRTQMLSDLESQLFAEDCDEDGALTNSQIIEMQMLAITTLEKENKELRSLLERQARSRMTFISGVVKARGEQMQADGKHLVKIAEAELAHG